MQVIRKLSPERQAELKRRYLAGEKYEVIQREMKMCPNTIHRYAYLLNIPLRKPWQCRRARST